MRAVHGMVECSGRALASVACGPHMVPNAASPTADLLPAGMRGGSNAARRAAGRSRGGQLGTLPGFGYATRRLMSLLSNSTGFSSGVYPGRRCVADDNGELGDPRSACSALAHLRIPRSGSDLPEVEPEDGHRRDVDEPERECPTERGGHDPPTYPGDGRPGCSALTPRD